MKTNHHYLLFKLLIISLLAVSCQPEEEQLDGMILINTESLHSHTKAVLNGHSSDWQNGDQIRFSNGTLATVSVTDGNYYVRQSGIASGTSAVYPASMVKEVAGVWTLTLPENYQYAVDGSGHQVIDMPMAAYYDGSGAIFFRHLTGGLYFNITNNTGSTVRLDRVTVENATQYMNGTTLALSEITSSFLDGNRVFAGTGDDVARRRVSLLFNEGLELGSGASRQVLVPVPAFTTDAAFTITVYAHNGAVSRYIFDRTQGVEHTGHIVAAEVGYANISLGDNVGGTPFEGNGTYAKPFKIYTKEDYLRMVDSVNHGLAVSKYNTKHFEIAADIDMGGTTVDGLRRFAGVIDGKGHTISNVCFGSSDNSGNLGMISTLIEAYDTIRNLTLDYVSFTEGGASVGAFIGYGSDRYTYVRLINCHLGHITYNNTLAATAYVGGLVGYLGKTGSYHHDAYFIGCSIEQPLSLSSTTCTDLKFGGLVGNIAYGGSTMNISDCYINADMTVDVPNAILRFGGMVGVGGGLNMANNTFVDGVHITANAKGTLYCGALIGASSGDPCIINGCSVTSLVMTCSTVTAGTSYVGGLIGDGVNYSNAKNFDNSTVSGSITLTKGTSSANSYLGMVLGKGNTTGIHWNDRGNSASVTLTVTNEGSTNDHIGDIYGI